MFISGSAEACSSLSAVSFFSEFVAFSEFVFFSGFVVFSAWLPLSPTGLKLDWQAYLQQLYATPTQEVYTLREHIL